MRSAAQSAAQTDMGALSRAVCGVRARSRCIEIVASLDLLAGLRAEWDMLWEQDPHADIFGSFDWFENWWAHFGHGEQREALVARDPGGPFGVPGRDWRLHVCVVRDNGIAVALLPLLLVTADFRGARCRVLSTASNGQAPCAGLLARRFDVEVAAALCDAIGSASWDVLLLGGLAMDTGRSAILSGQLARRGFVPADPVAWGHTYLKCDGEWASFVAARGSNFRRSLKRNERVLARFGKVRVERFTGFRAAEGLRIFQAVDAASWKSHGGEPIASETRLAAYYSGLVARLGASGRAETWVLYCSETPAAACVCVRDGRTRYTLKSSFGEAFGAASNASPGAYLIAEIVRSTWGERGMSINFVSRSALTERWTEHQVRYSQQVFTRDRLTAWRLRAVARAQLAAARLRKALSYPETRCAVVSDDKR